MIDTLPTLECPQAVLCETGLHHLNAGRLLDAQVCCRQALAIDPDCADACHLMGLLSLHVAQHELAVEWLARAIAQAPKAEYVSSLGTALHRSGRLEEASKALDKAVQLRPDDAGLWTNLGAVLEELKRPLDAVLCFQHALKLDPRHLEAACRCALLLQRIGRLDEALVHFDLCDELRPHHAATLAARSLVSRGLKRFEDYLADGRQAHALDPKDAEICHNVGDALFLLGRLEEALEWFDRTLALAPSLTLALESRAVVLRRMHRFDEAYAIYNHLISIDPTNSAKVELDIAHVDLLLGNFEAGWSRREARWRIPDFPIAFPNAPEPAWLGEESIEGKTILVYPDEGLGDTIQFIRYAPMLAARGAHAVLVVQDSLHALLSASLGSSCCLPSSAAALPAVDVRCPVMSLPLAFRTTLDTIPPPIRLSAPAERIKAWEERLGPHDKLRIGLAWCGSPAHANDHNRSIPLRLLTGVLDVDATFLSLQKDPRPDDAVVLERTDIVDLTMHLTDFSETAALVSCLDLVITVDTSIAHLAGSLGCPTWIMLAHTPDYRWLLNRDDSPWYPAVRLFRQTSAGDFVGVIERVRAELSEFALEQ